MTSLSLIPYHGQSRIAEIISDYAESMPQAKDVTNRFFTARFFEERRDATCPWFVKTVKEYLGEEGNLGSKEEIIQGLVGSCMRKKMLLGEVFVSPRNILWGLKGRFFWQVFDAKYLDFGALVFDEGLHGGWEEPGYYGSIKEVTEYISDDPMAFPTTIAYQERHRRCCAHFDHFRTSTYMGKEETGKVANTERKTSVPIQCLFETVPGKGILSQFLAVCNVITDKSKDPDQKEKAIKELKELKKVVKARVAALNEYIAERSKSLGVSPIAVIELTRDPFTLSVKYPLKEKEILLCQENLFKQFRENIAKADSIDKKIECIADLFQVLEWLHPFPDGQGRTDLVCLGELLTCHGINPSILPEPYVSTVSFLNEWTAYLQKGIQRWQDVFASLDRLKPLAKPVPKVRDPKEESDRIAKTRAGLLFSALLT